MARIGLGQGWQCLFANDIDPAKCASYRANFGGVDLVQADIHDLTADDLPGQADLAWASFPCQDLSLAGNRAGVHAKRSGAFWGFHRLLHELAGQDRLPTILVIENVSGFRSSNRGADLSLVAEALAELGYYLDMRIIDAADFLPQSRPRLFILAWHNGDQGTAVGSAARGFRSLGTAEARFRQLPLPAPAAANADLGAIAQPDLPCFDDSLTAYLIDMMAPVHRAKLAAAHQKAHQQQKPVYGTLFRRMRAGQQRAEIRFDRAGCLRTPAGGSSKQVMIIAHPDGTTATRHISGREAARLMGLPDDYILQISETAALKLAGDGVAVPVVSYLAHSALEPLLSKGFKASLEPTAEHA